MKKILILLCGGTLMMVKNNEGALEPGRNIGSKIKNIKGINEIAKIKIQEVANIDSSNLTPSFWQDILNVIRENYSEYDGFVVVHGTDTMCYTASFLSFAIENLTKPVVFTGGQKTIDSFASDGVNNILNSVFVAALGIPEILIVFGTRILKANRTTKVSESYLDAFDSPLHPYVGEIKLEPEIYEKHNFNSGKTFFKPDLDSNIAVLSLFPGLNPEVLERLISPSVKGVIIKAYGPGNVPFSLLPFFCTAKKNRLPVVVLSQCFKGRTKMKLYEVGRVARVTNAISGGDMTLEAAVTKLMWVLGNSEDYDSIREMMAKNLRGERSMRISY